MKYYPGDVLDIYPYGKDDCGIRLVIYNVDYVCHKYNCLEVMPRYGDAHPTLWTKSYDQNEIEETELEFVGVMDISILIGEKIFKRMMDERLSKLSDNMTEEIVRSAAYISTVRKIDNEKKEEGGSV